MDEERSNSVLLSIKQPLGLGQDYNPFDDEIIMHINSVFMILDQLGVSAKNPDRPFMITGEEETWDDLFEGYKYPVELVKSYMYLKVRLIFDPPSTGVLHQAMERQISEFEWRINVFVEGRDSLEQYKLGPEYDSDDDDFDAELDS